MGTIRLSSKIRLQLHAAFQPTRPAWGETFHPIWPPTAAKHFNSLAPRGVRQKVICGITNEKQFQPTRPTRGETCRGA